jgi:LCP family protein required for cell wall assembly
LKQGAYPFVVVPIIAALLLTLSGCADEPYSLLRGSAPAAQAPSGAGVQAADVAPTMTLAPSPSPTAAAPTATPLPLPTTTITDGMALLQRTENIVVLGMDHRDNDPDPSWRTDTIMIMALDRPNNRVGVVNVPRDLYVNIPGYGMGKINQTDYIGEESHYPGGGPALLNRVLTTTLDIPIQHYVRVQMDGLVKLVDALGGVTVTLDCPLYERTPDDKSPNGLKDWTLPAGQVHLDGQSAKQFATYRYITSDFGRTRRQQQLVWALRNRALQIDVISRLPALWSALQNMFTTDLSLLDVVKLATLGVNLKPENVRGVVFSLDALGYDFSPEGASILVVKDKQQLRAELAHVFDAQPLTTIGKNEGGVECPPPPPPVPPIEGTATITPTLTIPVTVTVAVSATAVITATPVVTDASVVTETSVITETAQP